MEVVRDPGNDRDQVLVQMVNQYQGLLLRMHSLAHMYG